MKKSMGINYIYNLLYQIVTIMVPLITTPYVSRVLGATAIGDYSYTFGIVSYFGLAAATGTVYFAQREIAVRQNDKKQRSILFWEIFFFRVLSGILVLAAYTVFFLNFMPRYRTLFAIQYLTFFSWIGDITWYFHGTENFKITAIKNSAVKLAGTVLIFLFVNKTDDLWLYTLILAAAMLLGNLTMWPYVFREVLWPGIHQIHMFRNTREIMGLFVPLISIQLYTVLDKTMLGSLCNTTEVGYYSQTEKIVRLALMLPSAFITVVTPRIAVACRNHETDQIEAYYKKTLNAVCLLAMPMTAGCILVSNEFVPLFFGKGYEPVIGLMQAESLLFIILSLGQMTGNFLIAMNRQRDYTVAVTLAAAVNVVLNVVFVRGLGMGAMGAVIASVAAESVSTIRQLHAVRGFARYRPIIRAFARYLLPTGAMAMAVAAVQRSLDGAFSVIASVLAGTAVYGIILAAWGISICKKSKKTDLSLISAEKSSIIDPPIKRGDKHL